MKNNFLIQNWVDLASAVVERAYKDVRCWTQQKRLSEHISQKDREDAERFLKSKYCEFLIDSVSLWNSLKDKPGKADYPKSSGLWKGDK